MVRTHDCNFCGHEIEPGTGSMYVRGNQVLIFCSRRCRRSLIEMKRDPRRWKWTKKYEPRSK
ncbi:MAG: 50S ribosomal protein L24e [Candidatus Hodarchaeales archaeon]